MVYSMAIGSKNQSFYFDMGDVVRTLYCPPNRVKQFSKNGKYYFFDRETSLFHSWKGFKIIGRSNTSSILARRLWDSLWMEGWREKKQS